MPAKTCMSNSPLDLRLQNKLDRCNFYLLFILTLVMKVIFLGFKENLIYLFQNKIFLFRILCLYQRLNKNGICLRIC